MTSSRTSRRIIGALAGLTVVWMAGAHGAPLFTEATIPAGFTHYGETYGASWGDYNGDGLPDLFVNNHREWSALYRNNGDGTFTDVIVTADGSGTWKAKPKQDTHGAAWADFDNDGDEDLYVTTGGADPGLLLVNEGGVLYDRAPEMHIAQDVEGRLPVWLDYTGDGRLDMAIMVRSASRIYEQLAGATPDFRHVTSSTGVDCSEVDYGQLSDLTANGVMELICGDGTFPHNIYDTTTLPFPNVSALVPPVPRGTDSFIADFDNDLDPDVFVIAGKKIPSDVSLTGDRTLEAALGAAPGQEKGFAFQTTGLVTINPHVKRQIGNNNDLYIGAAGAHPEDVPFTLDPADPANQGLPARDPATDAGVFIGYDTTAGEWRVFLSGLEDHAAGAYIEVSGTENLQNPRMINLETGDLPERPSLLVNNGGSFSEVGATHGLTDAVSCVNVTGGDFDNDMDVDVYAVCRGGVENLPNRLYENLGDGTFVAAASPHGAEGVLGFHLADRAGLGDSAVTADYDVDGCLDLFVTNGLPLQPGRHDSGPDQLFRNRCESGNHWLELDLAGAGVGASNADGIGATVYVTAGGVTQMREQNGGYHRWSQNHKRLHFGLAGNTAVDEIRIVWPSGVVDVIPGAGVDVDRLYAVNEGDAQVAEVTIGSASFPAPQAGDECGEPSFNAGLHRGVFLWKNCASGMWSLRATAGTDAGFVDHDGSIGSDQPLVSVSPYKLEGADFLDTGVPGQLVYDLGMTSGGEDGFDFELAAGASGCLDIDAPADGPLLLGANSLPAQWPLDLTTLGACGTLPGISIADLAVSEAASSAMFTVTLSQASDQDVSVDYASADGTATAGDDYTAVTGTLVLPAGETVGRIDVPLLDDALSEPPETFTVTLGVAEGALVTDAEATATIEDDELYACGAPDIDAGTEQGLFLWQDCDSGAWRVRVAPGGSSSRVTFTGLVSATEPFPGAPEPFSLEGADRVELSAPRAIDYSLNVVNSGQDGFDFVAPSSGRTCLEVDATVFLGVSKDPVGSSVDLSTLAACSTLPEMTVADVTASEDAGTLTFAVTLSEAAASGVQVDYATADGSAEAGVDYTAAAGTLVIAAGETQGEIPVSLLDDALSEGSETFTLRLDSVAGAILADGVATGTIADDEVFACGAPTVDAGTEQGLFVWQDCGSNQWWVLATAGGGSKIRYLGQITATEPFPSVPQPVSLEGADFLDSSDPSVIGFGLNVVGSGQDGFSFETPASGSTCLSANAEIFVGGSKDPVGSSIDLSSLEACTAP